MQLRDNVAHLQLALSAPSSPHRRLHTHMCMLHTTLFSITACRKFEKQEEARYEWQEGDIQWTKRNSVVYPAVSSLAGLVAGMFGVGGGIVKVSYHGILLSFTGIAQGSVSS